jgi:predicted aconitase
MVLIHWILIMSGWSLKRTRKKRLTAIGGEALATAYRILVAIGEATGAKKLVRTKWAHISGVNYNTIGDGGMRFLGRFSASAKFAVKTTTNPMGYDRSKPEDVPHSFQERQENIAGSYERMGATPSFTCSPYEVLTFHKEAQSLVLQKAMLRYFQTRF